MLEIHAKTDVGLVRTNNEDYFFIDPDNRLIIVADGAGGYEYGEVASRLAVESCYQYLTREDYLQDTSDITQTLMDSITFANQQVIAYKKSIIPAVKWAPRFPVPILVIRWPISPGWETQGFFSLIAKRSG